MKRRVCAKPGCIRLACEGKRYCEKHLSYEKPKKMFNKRGESSLWIHLYNSRRWRRERERFLSMYPFCTECGSVATVVDHIISHKGDEMLFWDESNWQPLCASCHAKKTFRDNKNFRARGDGGSKISTF